MYRCAPREATTEAWPSTDLTCGRSGEIGGVRSCGRSCEAMRGHERSRKIVGDRGRFGEIVPDLCNGDGDGGVLGGRGAERRLDLSLGPLGHVLLFPSRAVVPCRARGLRDPRQGRGRSAWEIGGRSRGRVRELGGARGGARAGDWGELARELVGDRACDDSAAVGAASSAPPTLRRLGFFCSSSSRFVSSSTCAGEVGGDWGGRLGRDIAGDHGRVDAPADQSKTFWSRLLGSCSLSCRGRPRCR